jgi:hypothetical protein
MRVRDAGDGSPTRGGVPRRAGGTCIAPAVEAAAVLAGGDRAVRGAGPGGLLGRECRRRLVAASPAPLPRPRGPAAHPGIPGLAPGGACPRSWNSSTSSPAVPPATGGGGPLKSLGRGPGIRPAGSRSRRGSPRPPPEPPLGPPGWARPSASPRQRRCVAGARRATPLALGHVPARTAFQAGSSSGLSRSVRERPRFVGDQAPLGARPQIRRSMKFFHIYL